MMRSAAMMLAICSLAIGAQEERVPVEWQFNTDGDLEGWRPNGFLSDVRVANGLLYGKATGRDPFFTSPLFNVPTRPWQEVRFRIKCREPGRGIIFWSNTLKTKHGGFSPKKLTKYRLKAAGEWEIVRVMPQWQQEGKIIHIRLDIDRPCDFAIDWIRIVESASAGAPTDRTSWDFTDGDAGGWAGDDLSVAAARGEGLRVKFGDKLGALRSPALDVPLGDRKWISLRMSSNKGRRGTVAWFTSARAQQPVTFRVRGDGRVHTYNLDVGRLRSWAGKLTGIELRPSYSPDDEVVIESIRISARPLGESDVEVLYFGMEDALNRVGRLCRVMVRITNHGGKTASGLTGSVSFPDGVIVRRAPRELSAGADVEFDVPLTLWYTISADKPVEGEAALQLSGPGAPAAVFRTPVRITPPPQIARMGAIPEPRPARTKYLVGAYYYPAWETDFQWRQAERFAPIQKPVLGYYDEANPEIIDWQIKWYVEHGVSFFLVDWYWVAGRMGHTHYLPAFKKAKFRRHFKWAVMWANHNPPKTHSRDDWVKVTKYWINNYFRMPEYLHIGGKPAVFIWSPQRNRSDMGGPEGAAAMLSLSESLAKEAGLPGITFVSMRAAASPRDLAVQKQEGYTHATSYHWWSDARNFAADVQRFPYSLVADRSLIGWDKVQKSVEDAGLSFIPVADTGWDARPRHGERTLVIYGRTPKLFERILRDAKGWLDSRGENMLILGPCNEWTEGSYIEPCREFGFGMLDAIRDVFCEPGDRAPQLGPKDVGLGPYDFPIHERSKATAWTFDTEGDPEGWTARSATAKLTVSQGALKGRATSGWPHVAASPAIELLASQYPYLIIRLKLKPAPRKGGHIRVYWTTATTQARWNSAHVPLHLDEAYHDYVLHVANSPRWRGLVRSLRIHIDAKSAVDFWLDEVRLSKKQ